jgi:hypothetical protein
MKMIWMSLKRCRKSAVATRYPYRLQTLYWALGNVTGGGYSAFTIVQCSVLSIPCSVLFLKQLCKGTSCHNCMSPSSTQRLLSKGLFSRPLRQWWRRKEHQGLWCQVRRLSLVEDDLTIFRFQQCQSLCSSSWSKTEVFLQQHFDYQRGWSLTESDGNGLLNFQERYFS